MSKKDAYIWKAVPLPMFYGLLWWPFKGRYGCCGKKKFWRYSSYVRHYFVEHN